MPSTAPSSHELVVNQLIGIARDQTGLHDLGDDSFLEPMSVLVSSLISEARLTDDGLEAQKQRIVGLLVNRLLIEQVYKDHPEIASEEIVRPTCIVGLPRTGTTMLFRILAEDNRYFVPKFYEVRYPVARGELDADGRDARIVRLENELNTMLELRPELASIHPLSATEAEEEINLLEHSFYSTIPEAFCHVPTYSRWLEEHDNSPGYLYLVRMLKLLQWQKKSAGETAERWVLKTPHHLHHMELLLKTFPGADIILTHRDPLETIPSIASFHDALFRLGSNSVDPVEIGSYWEAKFAKSMHQVLGIQQRNPDRFTDVDYRNLLAHPLSELERIYGAIALPFTEENANSFRRWQDDNRRDRRAPHIYQMKTFGFTAEGLQQSFAEYRARHIDKNGKETK
jgi:hypothetical protein